MKSIIILILATLITSCGTQADYSEVHSLTDEDYAGRKYYLGWGAASGGDPTMMHNEVKYDVLHTHDIFTKEYGGSYLGETMIGTSVTGSKVKEKWNNLRSKMTSDDMYVQYSSGHGFSGGLAINISYDEMRNFALATPAKEVIVFTMACYSGNLVDSFNEQRSTWQNWQNEGRTLFVMASSESNDTSSTGPGTDSDEPAGQTGTAGSAYGHALWKSLLGYADGYIDGVKDGYLSLAEIEWYTKAKTKQIGGHKPVSTGVYDPDLIMNRVVPRSYSSQFDVVEDNMEELRTY